MPAIKDEAKKIIDNLPDDATWNDIMYEFYVRENIEMGLKDIENGNFISLEDAQKMLLSE